MKTRSQWVLAAALSSALAMGSAFAADDKAPIKIVTNNWTSQVVLSYGVGDVLKSKGLNVEYKPSDTQLQFCFRMPLSSSFICRLSQIGGIPR